MAEVTRNDKGEIESVSHLDYAGYKARVHAPDPITGRVRIITTTKAGAGSPVDLEPAEARRYFRDGLDLLGGEDD